MTMEQIDTNLFIDLDQLAAKLHKFIEPDNDAIEDMIDRTVEAAVDCAMCDLDLTSEINDWIFENGEDLVNDHVDLSEYDRANDLMMNEILELRNKIDEVRTIIDNLDIDVSGLKWLDKRIMQLEEERADQIVQSGVNELSNQVAIARRAINVLLEDRERTLKQRAKRMFTLTGNVLRKLTRRVHWHMPRR